MNAITGIKTTDAARAYLADDAAALLQTALRFQGPAALLATREHAARHEAGHAIQHAAEGRRVLSVKVFRRGPDWLGKTTARELWKADQDTDPRADLAQARILLAGPLAEWFNCASPAYGAGMDEVALARGIVLIASRKLQEDCQDLLMGAMAAVVETTKRHRGAFDQLTAVLMRERKVKGFPLRLLLASIDAHSAPH